MSSTPSRIYLDNAATSWPKPDVVYRAVDWYQRHVGAPAGRAGYAEATQVSQAVDAARLEIARLVGLPNPAHVVFTANGTDSLNLVIHGLLRQGDHVVTSVIEHNSVLRPLAELESKAVISVSHVPCDARGLIDPDDVRAAIRAKTRLVAISHASNVTGAVQPIADIGRIAREAGARFLCDAAQSLGHLTLDMRAAHIDYLASSGHKGLMGPLGTGLLAIEPGAERELSSTRQGGTGTQSETTRQPDELPWKFEAGNLNVPGIVGLGAGVAYLRERGLDRIEQHGAQLTARLLERFRDIPGLAVIGPKEARDRVPLVSVTLRGYDPQELALALDAAYRVQVRAGLHCSPLIHRAMGTEPCGGTVRFSLGAFTTEDEIELAARAVFELASSNVTT